MADIGPIQNLCLAPDSLVLPMYRHWFLVTSHHWRLMAARRNRPTDNPKIEMETPTSGLRIHCPINAFTFSGAGDNEPALEN